MLDVVERLENRLGGTAEAVFAEPLDVADPDGDLGEFVGVGVDFDAVELGGGDAGEETADAQVAGEGDDFFSRSSRRRRET